MSSQVRHPDQRWCLRLISGAPTAIGVTGAPQS